jgi:16S rRNA (uracil1498-N3)-methyltransferase
MECLYQPEMIKSFAPLILEQSEQKHFKVLRLKENGKVMVTNGKGLSAIASIHYNKDWNVNLMPLEFFDNFGELTSKISLMICKISDKDRLEFIIEKSTELGIIEILLSQCTYSQPNKINIERLKSKAVSAMKQSKRSMLPEIKEFASIELLLKEISTNTIVILLDEQGDMPLSQINNVDFKSGLNSFLIIVGPEGGLADEEKRKISNLIKKGNLIKWNLGNRRLRTETAAIKALSILTTIIEN